MTIGLDSSSFQKRSTQMLWRLNEGSGMAVYRLGFLDNGCARGITESEMNESLQTLTGNLSLGTNLCS